MQFAGRVRHDGSVRLDDKPRWQQALSKLKGKRIRLELEYEKAKRSSPQNRRFFVMVAVARHCLNLELEKRGSDIRMSKDDTHEWLDRRFLGVDAEIDGVAKRKHCSKLNTAEFSTFCDEVEVYFVEKFGADFGADEEMVREAGL